jgi:tRNA (Thr-GGU) A37 N-methylase
MDTLKERLIDYYNESRSDYGDEEIDNAIEILNDYTENLSGLSKWDKTLLLRLIDDTDLYHEVYSIEDESESFRNIFD